MRSERFKTNTAKRPFLHYATLAVASAWLLTQAMPMLAVTKQTAKLNIVLIISDDRGRRDSRCYGNGDTRTPHMDRLAKDGIRFTHAFAASTLCSPSRAVIAAGSTGRLANQARQQCPDVS